MNNPITGFLQGVDDTLGSVLNSEIVQGGLAYFTAKTAAEAEADRVKAKAKADADARKESVEAAKKDEGKASGMDQQTMLLIGGGVVALGLVLYLATRRG